MEPRILGDGRYVLLEELGQGGMATVWRATDTRLAVERAIKVLNPGLRSASIRSRFDREARLMARLEHPHIVPVHDVGSDGAELFMVMSLLRNGSVGDHVDRFGPLAPVQACRVVEGVLSALSAAHAQGVIHRDVKPQNVLIGDHGEVRLGDFGIARVGEGSSTRTGAVMGTFGFMPPEQRSSAKETDGRSDVYAVGALLVSVLLAEIPGDLFHAEALQEQASRIPEPLRPFVERCTKFSPADRYPDAESALAALREAMPALPPDPPETVPLGAGRARALMPQVPIEASSGSTLASFSAETYTPTIPAPPAFAPSRRRWAVALGVSAVLGLVGGGAVLCGGSSLTAAVLGYWASDPELAAPGPDPRSPLPAPGSPVGSVERDKDPPSAAGPRTDAADPSGGADPPAGDPKVPKPGEDPSGAVGSVAPDSPAPVAPVPGQAPADEAPEPGPMPPGPPANDAAEPPELPTLDVRVAAVPSAELEVDGTPRGSTPWSGRLPPGEHTVAFRRDGKLLLRRVIRVEEGGTLQYCWDLDREEPCSR